MTSTGQDPVTLAKAGVVVGLKALTGEVKPRLDIDVFLTKHPDAFNLMLQAMSQLQKDPSKLGYYGLAGIHGLPTELWGDVGKRFPSDYGGYCAHGVTTFPTWHRPYLSLVEQAIYLKMIDIAKSYKRVTDRQRYLDSAKDFRLPYFDYFRPRGGRVTFPGVTQGTQTSFAYDFRLPDIFNVKKVTVNTAPDSFIDDQFDNPLYTYKFTESNGQLPKRDQDRIRNTYSITQTVRHPARLSSDTHDLQALSDSLNSGREGRSTFVTKLLNSQPYANVSTVASDSLEPGDLTASPEGFTYGNLEGIHGNYHVLMGGSARIRGHLSDPRIASFDPVFWFHHCNIDRYWAVWTAMHPNEWFPQPSDVSILAENKKDLLPFYSNDQGAFHNSDGSRTTEAFGYIYDDFEAGASSSVMWQSFKEKYVWASRTPDHPRYTDPPAHMKPLDVKSTQFFQKASGAHAPAKAGAGIGISSSIKAAANPIVHHAQNVIANVAPSSLTKAEPAKIDPVFDRNWYIDSAVLRSASNGTFTIFFFLAPAGQLEEDPATFEKSPYLAGINHIFAAPRETCDNCGNLETAGTLASDTLIITPLLLDYLDLPDNGLESLRPEHVKPFLVKYLRWRVVDRENANRDTRTVPELKVNVSAEIYNEDGTKTYENYPDVVEEILQNASETATAAGN